LRNRAFQAVNPFSTVSDPAYTRVQAGAAFGGALKKDKTFYYFAYELTRRHETGFSSIGANNFELVPFDTSTTAGGLVPLPLGTILYSLRLDHNLNNSHRLTLRANVSPSTITGIEVSGEDQPFGQNAYSRTSQQTYRDVAGVAQETWIIGNNKVNDLRFQYARRGLSYFFNTAIPGGSDP